MNTGTPMQLHMGVRLRGPPGYLKITLIQTLILTEEESTSACRICIDRQKIPPVLWNYPDFPTFPDYPLFPDFLFFLQSSPWNPNNRLRSSSTRPEDSLLDSEELDQVWNH